MPKEGDLVTFTDEEGATFRGTVINCRSPHLMFEVYNPRATLTKRTTLPSIRIENSGNLLFDGQARIQHLHRQHHLRLIQAELVTQDETNAPQKASRPSKKLNISNTNTRVLNHVAHELRTPLLSIRAASQGIARHLPFLLEVYSSQAASQKNGPISAAHLEALTLAPQSIEHNIRDLNQMIDTLLENAQQKRNQTQGFQPFSARECVESSLHAHPRWSALKSIIQVECEQDFLIHGSPQLMRHVIFNLLSNADAALKKQSGKISITLENGQLFNYLHFKDSGTGIDADVLPHIFDDYFSTRAPGQGTGLGLAFCRDTLLCHGGDIDCHSVTGEFTHFTLRLPAADQKQQPPSAGRGTLH